MKEQKIVSINDVPDEAFIIDVRSHSEHSDIHLKQPHFLISLDSMSPKDVIDTHKLQDRDVYMLCKSGKRASIAAQMLEDAGLENIYIIKGGIDNIEEAKVNKRNVVSMERQVRIAAGLLVLLSFVLGRLFAIEFHWLGIFVACGLIYAGISNSCGLARLLPIMPWNK